MIRQPEEALIVEQEEKILTQKSPDVMRRLNEKEAFIIKNRIMVNP
jgi:hypothetical protein